MISSREAVHEMHLPMQESVHVALWMDYVVVRWMHCMTQADEERSVRHMHHL